MPSKPRLLELVLDAYREGDLYECIRLVRTLVEAAPQAIAPRQLLAALLASTRNGRQALPHYRRLLPLAVERGEVIRAIAFQKQIDVYEEHEELAPGRWLALQKQLRERGLPFLSEAPGAGSRPWEETQLLALPRAWFERIAAETRYEMLGLEARTLDVEAGTVWEVLAGRLRWSFALPDGRASVEALAADGDVLHVDPGLSPTARVTLVPELPVEVLRFEAGLARDLRLALSAGLHVTSHSVAGLTQETRAMLPTRPSRHQDLDEPPNVPAPGSSVEPLKLPPPADNGDTPPETPRDAGDWIEFGVLSLSDPAPSHEVGNEGPAAGEEPSLDGTQPIESAAAPSDASSFGAAAEDVSSPGAAAPDQTRPSATTHGSEPAVELPPLFEQLPGAPGRSATAAGDTAAGAPRESERLEEEMPADPAEELLAVPVDPPPPPGDQRPHGERRRHPRVTVSLESRMALLRLSGSFMSPVHGQLTDMSTSGFSIRFANDALGPSHAALADAVVAADLDLPGPNGSLRLAAQVRWLEIDDARGETRLGIEFVLLTEPDRRRIAGTLAKAALAAHAPGRKAA